MNVAATLLRAGEMLFGLLALVTLYRGAARLARQRAHTRTWDEDALAIAAIMTAVIIGTAMALGSAGALVLPAWLAALLLAGIALERAGASASDAPPGSSGAAAAGPSAWFTAALGGLAIAELVYVTRNPPGDRDSITYHLPMAAHWFVTHALGAPLRFPPESATYYPGNLELLQLLPMAIGHNDVYVGLVNVACLGLLALGVRQLGIAMGATSAAAEGSAALVATTPVCALLVKGLSADAAMAAFVVAALVFLLRWRREGRAAHLTLALLSLGFVAGCRFTGPAYAAIVLGLGLVLPGRAPGARPAPWWAFAMALLLGGFWLARNAVAIGNPFYPAETQLLGHTLPGTLPLSMLRRTTQIAAWREGFAGHLTLANLTAHYRALLVWLLAGVAACTVAPARRALRDAWVPALFALCAAGLYLVSFYGGVNLPSQHGEPPMLANGNVRYLLPAFAAASAVCAPLLGALLPPTAAAVLLGVASTAQMAPLWSRAAMALLAAGVLLFALRRSTRGPALAPLAAALMIGAVLIAAPSRGKLEARIWDAYQSRLTLLPNALVDSLRHEAHGRVIALSGVEGSWQVVGSRLEGRPAYVPVARTWKQARSMWDFTPDDRSRASQALWRANLRESGAAFVAIGWSNAQAAPVESLWCASDTTSFALRAVRPGRVVYRVK